MNKTRAVFVAFALALALLVGCLLSINTQAKPATAQGKVDGYATYLFLYAANVTEEETGAAKVVVDYGWLDCYQTTVISVDNTSLVTFQHSPDGVNWVDGKAFAEQDSATTVYLGLQITGTYMRADLDLDDDEDEITVTVKCTAKDLTR